MLRISLRTHSTISERPYRIYNLSISEASSLTLEEQEGSNSTLFRKREDCCQVMDIPCTDTSECYYCLAILPAPVLNHAVLAENVDKIAVESWSLYAQMVRFQRPYVSESTIMISEISQGLDASLYFFFPMSSVDLRQYRKPMVSCSCIQTEYLLQSPADPTS